jgi:hypothetical protein
MKLRFHQIERHRNGISGAAFHAITFQDLSEGRMVAIVFDQESYVAVFNLDQLAVGNITFGENSWRGDRYEPHLRKAIKQHDAA